MTLNLLRQATANPSISMWGYFNGKFNYNATPLGLLGISVIVHTKTGRQRSWEFRGKDVWSVGALMKHFLCQRVIPKLTISMMISDTTEFRRHHITHPSVTPEDRLLHRIQQLTAALQGAPSSQSGDQIFVLQYLKDTLTNCALDTTPKELTAPQHSKKDKWDDLLPPRVQPPVPRLQNPANIERPQAPRVLVPRPAIPAQLLAHLNRDRKIRPHRRRHPRYHTWHHLMCSNSQ